MEILIDSLFRGISIGFLYACIGVGFALILGVMKIINMVQGEFLMLGGFISYYIAQFLHINPIITLPFTFFIVFLIGVFIEPIIEKIIEDKESVLLLTFGLSMFIINVGIILFKGNYVSMPVFTETFTILNVYLPYYNVVNTIFAIATMLALFIFLKKTTLGKTIRAVSQNMKLAQACGIQAKKIRRLSFGLGVGISGMAGTLLLICRNIHPQVGQDFIGIMFAIVILGGLGDIGGAVLGGIIIGLVISFATTFLSSTTALAIVYLMVPVLLFVKPRGILNRGEI